ncbi:MAG: NTP pyrophosphatase (non-canonical NTP hydrolase) [Salibacteraceae bacterium]|jgi:NTP pyrophosphatase (non-canonical NTP hydrolase)
MTNYKNILTQLIQFRDERDWKQFHDSKNLATAISIEAAELNELYLWKTIKESEEVDIEKVKEELADVLSFAFLLAEKHGLDPFEIVAEKIKVNAEKYPVNKAKGTATKYTDL